VNTCPCCGQPIEATLENALEAMPPMMRDIVAFLARRRGAVVPSEDIVDYVYRDDPDGGPLWATTTVKVIIHRYRPKLQAFGWTVKGQSGQAGGYSLKVIQ
jgi:DNA-binding response OmpR family regulator